MHKLEKKLVVIFVSLAFLTSGSLTLSAFPIKKIKADEKEVTSTTQLIETVTVYRYGLDGFITTVDVEIELGKGQDINDGIAEKCEELFENDTEFQSLFKGNTSRGFMSFVRSKGRGLHIRLLRRIRLMFCIYPRDQKAYTTINPLIGRNTTTIEGPHSVLAFGFIGFKWWRGRISFLGFILRIGFVGFSLFTTVKKL